MIKIQGKRGLYPGSFNPWHVGHWDVLVKALQIFEEVHICQMYNPTKGVAKVLPFSALTHDELGNKYEGREELLKRVAITAHGGLLVDIASANYDAIIRGLRNGSDLQYEQNMQYWNEDLGLKIPVIYFVTDRKLSHISSSALRELDRFKGLAARGYSDGTS